jgi:hypothetical protein
MKRSFTRKLVALLGLSLFAATTAQAGVITGWDMRNVTVTPGPYTLYETYNSYLFTDATKKVTNGAVVWKETDNQAPGMKVVNGDDVTGVNCIMSTGFNPEDGSDKMCSDPYQYSKRWKLKHVAHAPLDVYFSAASGTTRFYGSLQKLTNATVTRLQGFKIELGFMVNGQFVASKAGDGLGFSDNRGRVFSKTVNYDPTKAHILSALFPHEMAGAPDANSDEPGYFFPTERMYFNLTANEDTIVSTGISANHLALLGQWLNADAVPTGIRFDDDWDVNTDNILVANCEGEFDDAAQQCLGTWVTYRSCIGLGADGMPCDSDGIRKVIPQSTIDAWMAHPQYLIDAIDDLGNLSLNYFITVGDNTKWPTPTQFVARFTPVPVDSTPIDPPPANTDVDVAVTGIVIPNLKVNATGDIVVSLKNELVGAASGNLEVVVKDSTGKLLNTYNTAFTTKTDSSISSYKFSWKAPSYKTTVTVTATAKDVVGEIDLGDNALSASKAIR